MATRLVHFRVIQGRDAHTACVPRVHLTGYAPVATTNVAGHTTCPDCRRAIEKWFPTTPRQEG